MWRPLRGWQVKQSSESEKGTVVVIAVGKCEKQQTFLFFVRENLNENENHYGSLREPLRG